MIQVNFVCFTVYFLNKYELNIVVSIGYCLTFKEIGKKYGGFDVSLIPIGAYEPRYGLFVKSRVFPLNLFFEILIIGVFNLLS